jgi:uncharacterized repeat protein (TIGR01451 family)
MTSKNTSPHDSNWDFTLTGGGAAVLLALGSLISVGVAQADTAAGTTLTNSVSVSYDDAGGTSQTAVTDSVDVTVALVPSVAWSNTPTGQTTNSGTALPGSYNITLTNTGNGSDTYTITSAQTTTCGAALTDHGFTASDTTLGATVSSGAGVFGGGVTTIPVSNLTLTDFAIGNDVLIGTNTYSVAAGTTATSLVVEDSATGTGTADASADVTAAGVQIGETAVVSFGGGTAGNLTGVASCDHVHVLTATGEDSATNPLLTTNPQASANATAFNTTVEGALVTVNKFVRNVTTPGRIVAAATADFTWDALAYHATAEVMANPGEILEYVVVVRNAGAGLSTDIIFQDTLPTFTSADLDAVAVGDQVSIGIDQDPVVNVDGGGVPISATVGISGIDHKVDDNGVYASGTAETVGIDAGPNNIIRQGAQDIRIFPGNAAGGTTADETGSTTTGGGTGGSVDGTESVIIVYRIRVE